MEYFDVLDKNRNKKYYIKQRNSPLLEDEYNQGTEIYILVDNKILITKRSKTKSHPNMWEIPGGCSITGEDTKETALRELKEELNITITSKNLIFLNTSIYKNMFIDVYMYKNKIKIDNIKLQKEEVSDYKLVTLKEFKQMIQDKKVVPSVATRFCEIKENL